MKWTDVELRARRALDPLCRCDPWNYEKHHDPSCPLASTSAASELLRHVALWALVLLLSIVIGVMTGALFVWLVQSL